MLTEPVNISGRSLALTAQATIPSEKGISQRDDTEKSEKKSDVSSLAELLVHVRKNLKLMHNVDLQFSVHEATGEVMVTVRDESTGEVVREIPPSEILNLAARLEHMAGLMFDQKG